MKRRVYRWYVKLECEHWAHDSENCAGWLCITNRGYDTSVIEDAYSWKTKREAEGHAVLAVVQDLAFLNKLGVVRLRYC